VFLGGSAESFDTGTSKLSYTHFYFNPALGVLLYPDPTRGISIGARVGYLDDQVSQGNLTVSATGYQVSGELGFGFWVADDLELSVRGMVGFFDVSGSGSVSTAGSFASETVSRRGPYGGLFAALTFN